MSIFSQLATLTCNLNKCIVHSAALNFSWLRTSNSLAAGRVLELEQFERSTRSFSTSSPSEDPCHYWLEHHGCLHASAPSRLLVVTVVALACPSLSLDGRVCFGTRPKQELDGFAQLRIIHSNNEVLQVIKHSAANGFPCCCVLKCVPEVHISATFDERRCYCVGITRGKNRACVSSGTRPMFGIVFNTLFKSTPCLVAKRMTAVAPWTIARSR